MNPTHYCFQFDRHGRVLVAGPYRTGDLAPGATKVHIPQDPDAPRVAVVPRQFPLAAEEQARSLIDEQDGFN